MQLFCDTPAVLHTHRAQDLGALPIAKKMAQHFASPLLAGRVTRLLVDLNRNPQHPHVFSEFTRMLPKAERMELLGTYHVPHHNAVLAAINAQLEEHEWLLHVAVHSFTPVLHGQQRNADIGLLYDPQRPREQRLCQDWQAALQTSAFDLPVRRNYPYRGIADGLPTRLRRNFPDQRYAGVELEINQRLLRSVRDRNRVAKALISGLDAALAPA